MLQDGGRCLGRADGGRCSASVATQHPAGLTATLTLPTLTPSLQLSALTASLIEQLTKKGKEVNEFREKHNIRLVDEKTGRPVPSQHDSQTPGVLVS